MRGHGMPSVRGTATRRPPRHVHVVVPTKMNKRQRELLEEYAGGRRRRGRGPLVLRSRQGRVSAGLDPAYGRRVGFSSRAFARPAMTSRSHPATRTRSRRVLRLRDGDERRDRRFRFASVSFAARPRRRRGRLRRAASRPARSAGDPLRVDVAQGSPKVSRWTSCREGDRTRASSACCRSFPSAGRARAGAASLERWRRLARTAAAQCGRREIPEIADPDGFDGLLGTFPRYDAVLFAWELAPDRPLREVLPGAIASAGRVLAVVGPEGGFSHEEAERAAAAGARLVRLGRRILRTETAALVLVAVLDYASGASVPELGTTAS